MTSKLGHGDLLFLINHKFCPGAKLNFLGQLELKLLHPQASPKNIFDPVDLKLGHGDPFSTIFQKITNSIQMHVL